MLKHLIPFLILAAACLLAVACKTTGDPELDESNRQILVLACQFQCPIAVAVVIDACDGKVDGEVTEKTSSLYKTCVAEARVAQSFCLIGCDKIPLLKQK